MNLGSSLGGVIGGWVITSYYYKATKKDYQKQKILEKLESLHKDIDFAYKIQSKEERKSRLIQISYTSVQYQGLLLGNSVGDLQDILFKNSDNREETMVEITRVFKRYFPECFI
ncbi:hypothetical protein [Helicobacter mesocricetorum]|uniref:hypothetical protein n=1 Tax=Helicobacter mesocricetorum TaxID=87012 RepID=UPI00051FA4CB|nr:hypothetical protein [Helicobacter mesocricetorum]